MQISQVSGRILRSENHESTFLHGHHGLKPLRGHMPWGSPVQPPQQSPLSVEALYAQVPQRQNNNEQTAKAMFQEK